MSHLQQNGSIRAFSKLKVCKRKNVPLLVSFQMKPALFICTFFDIFSTLSDESIQLI